MDRPYKNEADKEDEHSTSEASLLVTEFDSDEDPEEDDEREVEEEEEQEPIECAAETSITQPEQPSHKQKSS